jgi:hypothetical protein
MEMANIAMNQYDLDVVSDNNKVAIIGSKENLYAWQEHVDRGEEYFADEL